MAQANSTVEEATSDNHQVCFEEFEGERYTCPRKRIATEKGKLLRLERLTEERNAAGVTLRKQITKMSSLVEEWIERSTLNSPGRTQGTKYPLKEARFQDQSRQKNGHT